MASNATWQGTVPAITHIRILPKVEDNLMHPPKGPLGQSYKSLLPHGTYPFDFGLRIIRREAWPIRGASWRAARKRAIITKSQP